MRERVKVLRCNLKNFLAEILDQSWEMPGGGKVIWLADVVTAEKRIEAELREKARKYCVGHPCNECFKEILGE